MKRRIRLGFSMFLLLLLAAVAILLWPMISPSNPGPTNPATSSNSEEGRPFQCAALVVSLPAPPQNKTEKARPQPIPESEPTNPSTQRTLVFKFIDSGGEPAKGVSFRYCLDDKKTFQRLFSNIRNENEASLNDLTAIGQTDLEGVSSVPVIGSELASIRLQITDRLWEVREFPRFPGKLPRGVGVWRLTGDTKELTIILCAADRREVEIRYEDGAPFTGEVRTWCTKDNRQVGTHRTFKLEGSTLVVLERVPADAGVHVLCLSALLGFEARSDFDFPPDSGILLTCEIKRVARPQAGIRVEVTGVRQDQAYRILILDAKGSAWGGDDMVGPGTYTWLEGDPKQKFFVTVRVRPKGGAVYQSDAITLKEGECVVVVAEPKAPVTYSVRAENEKGAALWPAILTSNTQAYSDFAFAKRNGGEGTCDQASGRAIGDSQGKVILMGVASSVTELLLDAEGCNPRIVKVSGQPGQTIDLGVIVLTEASGSLTVKLLNRVDGVSYRCTLLQPGGSPVASASPTKGETFALRKLALREYCVFVDAGNGLRGVSTIVALTESAPSANIEIDVSACELHK